MYTLIAFVLNMNYLKVKLCKIARFPLIHSKVPFLLGYEFLYIFLYFCIRPQFHYVLMLSVR